MPQTAIKSSLWSPIFVNILQYCISMSVYGQEKFNQ